MKNRLSLEERLRQNDANAFEEVYLKFREEFINYGTRYNLTNEELLDIYQDTLIAMHQNFVIKQTVLKSSGLKTYLFGIGKNKIFNRLKELKKLCVSEKEPIRYEEIIFEEKTITEEQELLAKNFDTISESCQEILKMYYYRNLTIKEIVQLSHYKDENTVKSHKSRCLKRLKSLIVSK